MNFSNGKSYKLVSLKQRLYSFNMALDRIPLCIIGTYLSHRLLDSEHLDKQCRSKLKQRKHSFHLVVGNL